MSPSKGSAMPAMPKADEKAKAFLRSVVPEHPTVTLRPMFGNLSAFVNGNMFMGVFGPDLFLRLHEADVAAVEKAGGKPFEPIPGRPMTGYVFVPPDWRDDRKTLTKWVDRSLAFGQSLPPKEPKPKARKK